MGNNVPCGCFRCPLLPAVSCSRPTTVCLGPVRAAAQRICSQTALTPATLTSQKKYKHTNTNAGAYCTYQMRVISSVVGFCLNSESTLSGFAAKQQWVRPLFGVLHSWNTLMHGFNKQAAPCCLDSVIDDRFVFSIVCQFKLCRPLEKT